jgi:hypothetical protein
MKEIWKILDYPGLIPGIYEISNFGNLRLKHTLDIDIKFYYAENKYVFAFIPRLNKSYVVIAVDDLVAVAFVECPDELIGKPVKVEHIDGNLRNNHYENLRWVEDIEEWRIVTYPGIKRDWYEVSSFGNIRRINSSTNLKPSLSNKGYLTINIAQENNNKQGYLIHRLIAHEFYNLNTDDSDMTVNHINYDKCNNYLKNLEVLSLIKNNEHQRLKYHYSFGNQEYKIPNVKIICELLVKYDGNIIQVKNELDKMELDISYNIIKYIAKKETWCEISDKYFKEPFKWSFYNSTENVDIICKTLVKNRMNINETLNDLIDIIPDITYSKILHIKYKHSYTDISDKYFKDIKYSM